MKDSVKGARLNKAQWYIVKGVQKVIEESQQ